MAHCDKDSKDYSPVPCDLQSRDQTDKSPNSKCDVGTSSQRHVKVFSSSSTSSSQSSLVSFNNAFFLPPALDGGWGWFVVLGAFGTSLICDGCALSFGVMFVHLLDEFHESKSDTALVASIFYAVSLLLGPVSSSLTSRFGCRPTTIAAGITSCCGFIASSFVTQVWHLYITFGLIVGASFSVCYVSSVLTVAYYFDKRRSLATGLSVCGTGIGTFTFAPLCEFLVALYGWRGSFFILGAICLNLCVCGALFRPLTFTPEQRRQCHLTAFNRLTRPVSRLSIPSRNRSRLHSTNSLSSTSSSSDSEDDVAALAYSQIEFPTFADPDKETVRIYLDKLRDLRRNTGNPQLALQRFFKSKDVEFLNRSPPGSNGHDQKRNRTPRVEYSKQETPSRKASDDLGGSSVDLKAETTGKRKKKKKKRVSKSREQVDPNKTLSDKSIQQLTEKLLENSTFKSGKIKKHNSDSHQNKIDGKLQCEDMPERVLERTQSEKTPGKLQCKMESGIALERSLSEKLPAKLQCQGNAGMTLEFLMSHKTNKENHRKVTTSSSVAHSSGVDPMLSGGVSNDMGMLLMNKHSTYLILHRNDIFFRGSRGHQKPVPCATSCPELSRLPPSDSESEDENCLVDECPCLEPVADFMSDVFDKKIVGHPLFLLVGLSNFLLYFWADVPYIFSADFALLLGIENNWAMFLISIIGIVNTVGQVVYGLVGDQDWNLTVIYGISCIGSGLAVLLLATAKTYWLMGVLCGLFGFFVAANYSLMTAMLVGYLGIEKLAHAYGLLMMVQGIANFCGPPVAGWIVDKSGYQMAFPVSGGFIMLSGVIVFLLYIIRLCSRFFSYCRVRHSPRRESISVNTLPCSSRAEMSGDNTWVNGPPGPGENIV